MTRKELRQAAVDCLGKAFKGHNPPPAHVMQAEIDILAQDPLKRKE